MKSNNNALKNIYLPDIFRGTCEHRIRYTKPAIPWTWRSSYKQKLASRTGHSPTMNHETGWLVCHQPDIRIDRSIESFCFRHYERSSHLRRYQNHLQKKKFGINIHLKIINLSPSIKMITFKTLQYKMY